jgi:hypothetical protein
MAMQMQVSRPETAGVALALPEIVSCIVWHAAGSLAAPGSARFFHPMDAPVVVPVVRA